MLYHKRRSLLTSDLYVQRLVALQRTSQRSASVAVGRGNEMMDDPVFVSDVPNLATEMINLAIVVMVLWRLKAFFVQEIIDSFS